MVSSTRYELRKEKKLKNFNSSKYQIPESVWKTVSLIINLQETSSTVTGLISWSEKVDFLKLSQRDAADKFKKGSGLF